MKRFILFSILLCFCLSGFAQIQGTIEEVLWEANENFTHKGELIHPGLIQEFSGWISDSWMPITVTVDIAAASGSNEYFDDDVEFKGDGSIFFQKKGQREYFYYKWLGRLRNGLHVLETGEGGGGSGIFKNIYFIKFDIGKGYTPEGKEYDRLLMTAVRNYMLGDRDDGDISVSPEQNKVTIGKSKYRQEPVILDLDINMRLLSRENVVRADSYGEYVVQVYRISETYPDNALVILKDGEVVYQKDDHRFYIGHIYEDMPEGRLIEMGNDITGDGEPNLVVAHWSGGAHCCVDYYVFSIGDEFKLLDVLNAKHSDMAKFINVDEDKALEFITNDWTFAYWNTCFAGSPAPSVVLDYADEKYHFSPKLTQKYYQDNIKIPSLTSLREPRQWDKIVEEIKSSERWGNKYDWSKEGVFICSDVWSFMLDLIYSGHPEKAWEFLDKVWPEGKPGKESFLAEFKEQLNKSPYWQELKEAAGESR